MKPPQSRKLHYPLDPPLFVAIRTHPVTDRLWQRVAGATVPPVAARAKNGVIILSNQMGVDGNVIPSGEAHLFAQVGVVEPESRYPTVGELEGTRAHDAA